MLVRCWIILGSKLAMVLPVLGHDEQHLMIAEHALESMGVFLSIINKLRSQSQ